MNRDIVSVLLGGFGTKATGGGEAMAIEGEATMTTSEEVAMALTEANKASKYRQHTAHSILITVFVAIKIFDMNVL